MSLLLLAEPENIVRAFLKDNLSADRHTVQVAFDLEQTLTALHGTAPDLILADLGDDTLRLIDWLRDPAREPARVTTDTPLIALTSQREELHGVRLLQRGADDVLAWPYGYPELLARITALLRRSQTSRAQEITTVGPMRIDRRARTVTIAGQPIPVSDKEYRLLCELAQDPGRVFTRAELLHAVWGYGPETRTRTLDTHATRLRSKLRQAAPDRALLANVWGVGYQLDPGAAR